MSDAGLFISPCIAAIVTDTEQEMNGLNLRSSAPLSMVSYRETHAGA
jgi:hypothetical protein